MSAQEWDRLILGSICRILPDGNLIHPGLPLAWGVMVLASVALISGWGLIAGRPAQAGRFNAGASSGRLNFSQIPGIAVLVRGLTTTPWVLSGLRLLTAALFLAVIWAGLAGTPLPSRNLATMLTWNIWWSGVILSVFFMGSAWCAICPWDALASWIVRRRLWKRADVTTSLNLRVPKQLRNVWPALGLLVGLTWLELGVGITKAPYATAVLALAILVLAIVALAVFERKAFCRFACPVGRTIGFYSQLAPVELRPANLDICASCTTLECYHGSTLVDPCPTHQVMGRMTQNTFCTSCGNCARACPHKNVAWQIRPPSTEALQEARPHWDEAWFMLALLALTGFHGLTMMEFWETWIRGLAQTIGDSGQLLWSFSIGMIGAMVVPLAAYGAAIKLLQLIAPRRACNKEVGNACNKEVGNAFNKEVGNAFRDIFIRLSFVALPLAFAYHLAHNLAHLLRESIGAGAVFANPLGTGILPYTAAQQHERMTQMILSPTALAALQALLLVAGFWMAVMVIRRRGAPLLAAQHVQAGQETTTYQTARDGATIRPARTGASLMPLMPVVIFAALITAFHLWLLMQPMVMRV